ncbi:hypothetical protein HMPREF3188_00373 [Tissierellia bacterium KA00581]|jgi:hypothetical protein|nr:hypothetical protein HMPREF3188_00373 [Tissierellia bacterium KA00581]
MKKEYLSMQEIKKIELDILKYIHNFCIKNNIKYFINYGTLLGAIRHKGFIPWDDDIDIMMPRDEYEKFINLFSKDDSIYKIVSMDSNKQYFNNFIKVINSRTKIEDEKNYKTYECGIFIDIFPYDKFNDFNIVNKTYNLESFKLLTISKKHNIQYGDSKIKDLIRLIFWIILRPFSARFFAKKIDKIIKKKTDKNGKYVGVLGEKLKEKAVFNYDIFNELIEVDFENNKFFAPKEYDKILSQYYGDYMKFPPVEKQKYSHEIKAYFID